MAPIYVISLERSTQRWAQISAALQSIGWRFERVPAIDASTLDPAIVERVVDAEANNQSYLAPLSPAEVACFLSHRLAWQTFLRTSDDPFAVFLEDDAVPLSANLDWQILHRAFGSVDAPQIIKLYHPPAAPIARLFARRRPLMPPLGAVAQAMNRAAVEALLKFSERFHEPVDVALQRWWDHGVRVTVARPLWFREAAGDSTIRSVGETPHEGRWLREIRRPLFQSRRMILAMAAWGQGRRP